MGVGRKTARKRAVGTREHIISYLTEVGELFDANGMASTRLAAAVGYPGSSVAFAQLLSGMERSGLIEREVRGKRTYRIRLGPVAIAGPAPEPGRSPGADRACPGRRRAAGLAAAGGIPAAGTAGFDYDELARRLLVQVVRRLAAADPEASQAAVGQAAGPGGCGPGGGSFRAAAGDGHRAGVRAGHGLDQARQAGRGERPAPGAAQRGAAVAGAGRRAGPQGCPSAPAWTAARSCCCSGCSPRPGRRTARTTPARRRPAWLG